VFSSNPLNKHFLSKKTDQSFGKILEYFERPFYFLVPEVEL